MMLKKLREICMVGIPKFLRFNSSRSMSQILIDFTIDTCGLDYLRDAFNQIEDSKKIYTHDGCDAEFPVGTKVCPKCNLPIR